MPTTTHLVCAPDDLATPAVVMEWLAAPGAMLGVDAPLVRIVAADQARTVLAPLGGVLAEHCIAVGEAVAASDLLAMIEADEPPLGITLLLDEDAADNLAVPACRLASPANAPSTDDAIALCAALGIAPAEIARDGALTRAAVERHVRRELRLLSALREMLRP